MKQKFFKNSVAFFFALFEVTVLLCFNILAYSGIFSNLSKMAKKIFLA